MNWCKLGFHDWEVINETNIVKKTLIAHLLEKGYREENYSGWVYYKNDKISIPEFAMHHHLDIEGCMPIRVESKVCLRCKKVVMSYNIAKCLQSLQDVINEKMNQRVRRDTAAEIREKL
jgi:hypothetical protein